MCAAKLLRSCIFVFKLWFSLSWNNWYQRVVFRLLKQIVPFLRWITPPAVHMQIGSFLYKTDKARFSKASVTLSVTGFTAIMSTGLPCFFFFADLFFVSQLYFLGFLPTNLTAFLILIIFYYFFSGTAVFLVFHVFYV